MLKLLLFLLTISAAIYGTSLAHQQIPGTPSATLEPEIIESLFYGDTCFPPCWFGLMPGESTTDEVLQVLRENLLFGTFNPDLLDNQGEIPSQVKLEIQESGLGFMWTRGSNGFLTVDSYLAFEDDTLHSMKIRDNNDLILEDVLRILGQPHHVRASHSLLTVRYKYVVLILFYPERYVAVDVKADPEDCRIRNMRSDFRLDSVHYYASSQAATFEADNWLNEYWLVPEDTWNRWLRGNTSTSCLQAVRGLFRSNGDS